MIWVWLTVGAWVVAAVLTSGVLGRAIRCAEWEELGHRGAGNLSELTADGDVIALPAARRAGRATPGSRARQAPPLAAGGVRPPVAPAPRRSDQS